MRQRIVAWGLLVSLGCSSDSPANAVQAEAGLGSDSGGVLGNAAAGGQGGGVVPQGGSGVDSAMRDGGARDAGPRRDAALDAQIPDAASCEPWTATNPFQAEPPCEQEPPIDHGPFGYRVALTFDDGPSPETTPTVVALLRQEQIPATFFMVGRRFMNRMAAPGIALDIHLDPLFRIANHTFTHARLPDLELPLVVAEIDDTSEAIRSTVQDPCYFPAFFRFPFSDSDCPTMQVARERGLGVAGVHIDSSDWCYSAGDGFCPAANVPWMKEEHRSDPVAHVLEQLDKYQGGIVLMHDIHQVTLDFLPALIDALREAGVTFVALDDAEVFPLMNAQVMPPEPPACCAGIVR